MNDFVGKIQVEIDLRPLWAGVRDQGMRSSCLACAASDCHKHAQSLEHPLSVEHLFYGASAHMPNKDVTRGLTLEALSSALKKDGQCAESHWPYVQVQPNPWAPPAGITRVWRAEMDFKLQGTVPDIVSLLQAGTPTILAVRLRETFLAVQEPDYVITGGSQELGGHAVVAVGCGVDLLGEEHVLIRNSWGFQWGFGGHAWLSSAYVSANLLGFSSLGAI
jgi:hypothetical protein